MAAYLKKLVEDQKAAMKAGDKARLEVIRMLVSELKKRAIDAQTDDLPDDEEVAVLQKAVKTRADTIAQAKAAGRAEIAAKEQSEIDVITAYLPKQMSAAKVRELAAAIGYQGGKDTGRFMKEWMARYKGLADGKLVQDALKTL
jgi:uncharacterized protein